ncbi:Cadherin-87A [Papilio machaon]|uniref:Cadherin-87A n=1 Tax=Papilio machaon TaxID=76193 RepID=A0A0N0PDM0_PAPMA|nr:Cadherin-87A [Papilio machaon]
MDVGALVSWFSVRSDGEVSVAGVLRRNMAAVVTLPVQVTDASAPSLQRSYGEFGEVTYNISGELSNLFTIDTNTGMISIAEGAVIDRENITDIYLRAVATDNAPPQIRKTTSVPVHIKVVDENDNAPVFTQKVYKSTIAENLQLEPPAAILQVLAEDRDEGDNGKVQYSIEEQSEPAQADYLITTIKATDADSGDNGRVSYYLKVDNRNVRDTPEFSLDTDTGELRTKTFLDREHKAEYQSLPGTNGFADRDNGRVSYYLKVDNRNVRDTPEFSLDTDTGELRTKTFLDREHKAEYQLVIAAVDNGTPAQFESLRLLTVVLSDEDDNTPRFTQRHYQLTLAENLPPGIIVGSAHQFFILHHLLRNNLFRPICRQTDKH